MLLDGAGDYGGAEAALSRALELAPERADAWYTRGTSRVHAGAGPGALADLTRALELRPGWPEALFNRALVHEQAGAREAALADLRQAAAAEGVGAQLRAAIEERVRALSR